MEKTARTELLAMSDAVAQAYRRADRERQPMVVYIVDQDVYGRRAIYYVRPVTESAPEQSRVLLRTDQS